LIAEMKRCDLIVYSDEADKLVEDIAWLGAVEIKKSSLEFDPAESVELKPLKSDLAEFRATLASLDSALKTLLAFDESKKKLFAAKDVITRENIDFPPDSYFDAINIADETAKYIKKQNELKIEKNRLASLRLSLIPWKACNLPLDFEGTAKSFAVFGSIPANSGVKELALAEFEGSGIAADLFFVSSDESDIYAVVVCYSDDINELDSVLNKISFNKINLTDNSFKSGGAGQTASYKIEEIDKKIDMINDEIDNTEIYLTGLAKNIGQLKIAYDITAAKIVKAELKESFLATEKAAFIQGYIPEQKTESLEKITGKYTCSLEISDVSAEDPEDVPVLLKNKKIVKPFESVVGLYSYPAYTGFDATFIMSLFYFVIFGLMFADLIYGLLLTAGGLLMVKLLKPKKGMRQLIMVFVTCGISCMICGVLFGGYFGDMPSAISQNLFGGKEIKQYILFDPLLNPISYLIISLTLGFIHIFTGMGIKIYMLIKRGQVLDAIFGTGVWYLIFGGIGLYFLNPNCIWITVAGIAGMALMKEHKTKNPVVRIFKGLFGLYDIISYIADVLSYARILAIGLAGTVIAMVMNLLGTMAGPPVGFFTIFIAIAIGHLLNIALSTLGAFVHSARLQYIEFFGKFYEDGGRAFSPVAFDADYTEIIE